MFYFEKESKVPLYQQLYKQLRTQIAEGTLTKGQRLPSTRELSAEYHLSRNTVIQAYKQLEVEGYVCSAIGSGYYVEEIFPTGIFSCGPEANLQAERLSVKKSDKSDKYFDFSYGDLDYNCYQSRAWHKCLTEAYETFASQKVVSYDKPQGLPGLRLALSKHLNLSRGIRCYEDQIIVTAGHQQSLRLVAKLFAGEGRNFAMENPGYDGTRIVMQQSGFAPIPIPLEENGISVEAARGLSHALLYITPSHQFPMGSVLPIAKRIALLQWAEESGSYILEDDYDSEFRYHSLPIPSLQSIDRSDRTIYMGTFSKSLSPNLRVAYIVLPKGLLKDYQRIFSRANCDVSSLIQYTLALFIHTGEYQKHINVMRTNYQKKHDYIVKFFNERFPDSDRVSLLGQNGGLHFILSLHPQMKQKDFLTACAAERVRIWPLEKFRIDGSLCTENQFLLGFGSLPLAEMPDALEALYRAICDSLPE